MANSTGLENTDPSMILDAQTKQSQAAALTEVGAGNEQDVAKPDTESGFDPADLQACETEDGCADPARPAKRVRTANGITRAIGLKPITGRSGPKIAY